MKTIFCVALAGIAITLSGATALISQDEALVSNVLTDLKFEPIAANPVLVGAPPKFKVTKKTIAHLESLLKDAKTIEVQANGQIKIVK